MPILQKRKLKAPEVRSLAQITWLTAESAPSGSLIPSVGLLEVWVIRFSLPSCATGDADDLEHHDLEAPGDGAVAGQLCHRDR